MVATRERLEGTRVWSVWEKKGAARNPWKVPAIALVATHSSRTAVCAIWDSV